MQVNAQPNEQAGNPVNNIFAVITTVNTLANIAKVMVIDVVRPQRGSFTAIYSNAGFEDFEKYSSIDVVETI